MDNHSPVVVYADMSYKPIEWWSEQWGKSVSTIKGWIQPTPARRRRSAVAG